MNSDRSTKSEVNSRSYQLKTKYLENIVQALRTPLNSIIGFSKLINERAADSQIPQEILQYLKHIQVGGTQLLNLSSRILELSLLETNRDDVVFEEIVSLDQLVQSICQIYQVRAGLKSLWFTYDIDTILPDRFKTDKSLLTQVLSNLIDNAIKFTEAGKSIRVLGTVEKGSILISIEDEGIGMSEPIQASLASLFEGSHSPLENVPSELGFGLVIVKKILDLLGGKITFVSTPGKGSRFSIFLPLSETTELFENIPEDISLSLDFPEGKKVLIIEDNPTNLELYQNWFEDLPLEVHYAIDGSEGIKLANTTLPNLIITDIHLPGIDGITVIHQIKQNPNLRSTPIVILTAGDHFKIKERAIEVGCNEYLAKPIEFEMLIEILHRHLDDDSALPPSVADLQASFHLPQSKQTKMEEMLKRVLITPIYHLEKISADLSEMRELFSEEQRPIPEFVHQLELAAFNGDSKALSQKIHHYFEHQTTRST